MHDIEFINTWVAMLLGLCKDSGPEFENEPGHDGSIVVVGPLGRDCPADWPVHFTPGQRGTVRRWTPQRAF